MRRHLDPLALDRLLAIALLVGTELEIALGGSHSTRERIAAGIVGAAITAAVAARRRFPAGVGIGVQAVLVLQSTGSLELAPAGPPFVTVAWFCALYALVAWTTTRWFVIGLAFFVVSDALPEAISPDRKSSTVYLFTLVTAIVMLLVRRVLGDRDRRLRLAERERDLVAREAVVEERARIARELHDAIAHDVSLMVMQAGAERRVLAGATSTSEVLQTIEQVGRGALTEMRRLVGMLRSNDGGELAPQPSLADLPRLVGQVTEAGLPVELEVIGEPRELPLGIELSAYRIVQEALTNALRHAGDARATVRVRYGADQLELEVVDDGAGVAEPVASGGHGLVGMRERVALYGGRFDAGRKGDRGFSVRVVLPIR